MKSKPGAFRRAREAKGHSQASLSKASTVSQSQISGYEADASPVRPTTAKKIAVVLGVEIEDIFDLTEEDEEVPAS